MNIFYFIFEVITYPITILASILLFIMDLGRPGIHSFRLPELPKF